MATCAYCDTSIWFGGVKDGDRRFCNDTCHTNGALLDIADQVPRDVLEQHIETMRQGDCPLCNGPGPIEVHRSYKVWSAIVLTRWSNRVHVCCTSCARRKQLGDMAFSALLGWWGLPWGFIMTPVQIVRNVGGLSHSPDPKVCSPLLARLIKLNLADHILRASMNRPHPT